MDLFATLILLSLAGWTLVDLLIYQRGPFGVLEKLREAAGSYERDKASAEILNEYVARNPREDPALMPEKLAVSELGELFSCPWCMSVWVAFVLVLPVTAAAGLSWPMFPVNWFAVRGGIMLWERIIRG